MKGRQGRQPGSGQLESASPARGIEKRKRSELISFSAHSLSISYILSRIVFNRALSMKLIKQDIYPFNDFKVSKFDVRTKKRAVTKEDVKKIMSPDLSVGRQYMQLARDIFLFSYFGAGINFPDIAPLCYCDIQDGRIRYIRKKTGKEISFPLSDARKEIIRKYSRPDATSSDYILCCPTHIRYRLEAVWSEHSHYRRKHGAFRHNHHADIP